MTQSARRSHYSWPRKLLGECRFLWLFESFEQGVVSLVARLVPDELWESFVKVVPPVEVARPQGGGRRRAGDREVLAGIVFVVTANCTWRELPPVFGPHWQTVYRRFNQWSRAGVWGRLHLVTQQGPGESEELDWVRFVVGALHRCRIPGASDETEPGQAGRGRDGGSGTTAPRRP
ncbi:transposase [Kitasatospora sp. NPDC088351]|uniref:transposase n=1 Tax=Kitasatospora sp. NPDC088351 TaxID=3155180 RepID=UPI0034448730